MGRVLSGTSYVLLFVLTPLAFLIMLSQNAIPGDLFYPVKRIFEKGILVAAAVHPTTRAMFHTNLSERRFYEAYTMLARANTSGLDSFVEEIKTTQETIVTIVDSKQKQQLEEKLVAKIDEYQVKLTQVTSSSQIPSEINQTAAPTQQTISQPTSSRNVPTELPTSVPLAPPPTVPPAIATAVAANPQVVAAVTQTHQKLEQIKQEIKDKERQEKKEKEDKDKRNDKRGDRDKKKNKGD